MRRALALAARGRGRTRPNPIVGAVVVRGGRIVGEGWHRQAGRDHAEVVALRAAGARARGATLYVTLEPCAHVGRTPPCTEAVKAAGIARCVVAMRDPHAIVDGRGLQALRRAGIRVDLGCCAAEARALVAGYRLAHLEGRPRVTWKIAATADGATADARGRSQWITGPEARRAGHRLRAASDAVVIGAGTARADDPRLTARTRGVVLQPLRVVCDTHLRLPLTLRLFRKPLAAGTVVACGRGASAARRRALEARGIQVWMLPWTRAGVSPVALARRLAAEGCHEVLMESGGRLGGKWLELGLVDRIELFVAPRILGAGRSWSAALGSRPLAGATRAHVVESHRVGADVRITLDVEANGVHRTG